jgi:phage tail-like protein
MSLFFIDPGQGLRFVVVIDGVPLGNWQKCEGLTITYKTESYEEGGQNGYVHKLPGRVEYENIKLTRPVDPTSGGVATWVASVQLKTTRGTAAITVLDPRGIPVTVYMLYGVYPTKYAGPSFDVSSKNVAMETLELAHNGFLGPR